MSAADQPVRPSVSVVVPTYRRPDLLARCLAALQRQTLSAQAYEIIVCDDGPSDAARAVATAAGSGQAGAVRYLEVTASQGPAGARNVGWRHARAPIIAFTDDDTVPDPNWLMAGLRAMEHRIDAVTGRIVMPLPAEPTDIELDAAGLARAEFVTANCFVRRDVLQRVGGFDERFSMAWREDSDLHFTLLEAGCRLTAAPDAVVVHPLRGQRFAAGIGMQKKVLYDVLLFRKHPRLYRERIRSGPPWFYLGVAVALASVPLLLLAGHAGLAGLALAAWALATLWFFLRRLLRSAFTLRNVGELAVTSPVIPLLSIYWRLRGIARFGAVFP